MLSGCALGHSGKAAVFLWFFGWVGLLLGSLQRSFGREVGTNAFGQVVLLGDVGRFEGAEGLAALDLLALAFPPRRAVQVGGGLLQGIEHKAGALVVDAVVGEGVEHLHERSLHSMHVFEHGELNAAGLALEAGTGRLQAAGASLEVEVTEILATKSGRIAVDAIFLEMVAGRVGHKASSWLALRFSRLAFGSSLKAVFRVRSKTTAFPMMEWLSPLFLR